jgi:hypothetical protein
MPRAHARGGPASRDAAVEWLSATQEEFTMSNPLADSRERTIADKTGMRRGLAWLLVLLTGLLLAAGLLYFLDQVFAKWFIVE